VKFIRAEDLVWLLLFMSMILFGPERGPAAIILLVAMAVFQVAEPKISPLSTERGIMIGNVIKLALGYLLIAYTDGVASSYYFILLFPVVSAATSLGLLGTLIFIVLSSGAYLSFLLTLGPNQYIPADQVPQLLLRVVFITVVGFLTHQLAESTRVKAKSYQTVAEQLSAANRSLREAEAAVRRADRLAALGQLTAGLAHELRNPMSTIKNSAEMLQKMVPAENTVAREMAGYISTEVDRTNSLITRFLMFARPLKPMLEQADIASVIDRAIDQVERQNPAPQVTIYKNYSPDIRPVEIDSELIERVIYNLLMNAAQASPAQSAVTVKTRDVNGTVEISVIDRGSGIDPKHLESIFNPFFTTKSDGVGLGLAIVSKIVDEHDGKIVVESHPGEGSVFRVYLPAKPKAE
jgi:two-component system, NtrC family, sensor histidine kinase HydH